jgi:transcriptional regulator with XRE-family HTH domain
MSHPLKVWLKEQGLSVQQFAERTSVSYVTIYRLLRNEGTFTSQTLIDIANATHGAVSPSQLMDELHRSQTKIGETPVNCKVTNNFGVTHA